MWPLLPGKYIFITANRNEGLRKIKLKHTDISKMRGWTSLQSYYKSEHSVA